MTDPADNEFCDCDPAGVELHNGWTLTGPPGTSRAAAEYAARRLYDDDYLPSPDDAQDAAEEAARQAERDAIGPMHGPVTEHQHLVNEMLLDTLGSLMGIPSSLTDFMFRATDKAQKFGTVVYETTNPGGPSPTKDRFMPVGTKLGGYDHTLEWEPWDTVMPAWGSVDGAPPRGSLERAQYEGNWNGEPPDTTSRHSVEFVVDVSHHHVRMWERQPADDLTEETFELIQGWTANPPARPGWTGSITGRPRPIPLKPTPWQTLPKGVHDGNRTVIIEPGADSNPDARRLELRHGKWVDIGPWFPNGLRPAYRGRPAPIPWDSPLADPVADMQRAIEEDQ